MMVLVGVGGWLKKACAKCGASLAIDGGRARPRARSAGTPSAREKNQTAVLGAFTLLAHNATRAGTSMRTQRCFNGMHACYAQIRQLSTQHSPPPTARASEALYLSIHPSIRRCRRPSFHSVWHW